MTRKMVSHLGADPLGLEQRGEILVRLHTAFLHEQGVDADPIEIGRLRHRQRVGHPFGIARLTPMITETDTKQNEDDHAQYEQDKGVCL